MKYAARFGTLWKVIPIVTSFAGTLDEVSDFKIQFFVYFAFHFKKLWYSFILESVLTARSGVV